MRVLAHLPLAWVRALGWLLGRLLYFAGRAAPPRGAAQPGPVLSAVDARSERARWRREIFVASPQSWLDRSWLWHGKPRGGARAAQLTGAVALPSGTQPHRDAVRAALRRPGRRLDRADPAGAPQASPASTPARRNTVLDAWMLPGRQRFGSGRPFGRADGVKAIDARAARRAPAVPAARHEFRARGIDLRAVLRRAGGHGAVALALRQAGAGQGGAGGHAAARPRATRCEVLPAWDDFPTDDARPTRRS